MDLNGKQKTSIAIIVVAVVLAIIYLIMRRRQMRRDAVGLYRIGSTDDLEEAGTTDGVPVPAYGDGFPLGEGSRTPRVGELQRILNALGIRDGAGNVLSVDNSFGPRTKEAVAKLPGYRYRRMMAWHYPFGDVVTRDEEGEPMVERRGYDTLVAFYNEKLRPDGSLDIGSSEIDASRL